MERQVPKQEEVVDIEEKQRPLQLQIMTVGPVQACCYIVSDKASDEIMVIDPGGDGDMIVESLRMMDEEPRYIVITHGHGDHIGANAELKTAFPNALLCIHEADRPTLASPELNLSAFFGAAIESPDADRLLRDGDELPLGDHTFKVLHVPGHSPGGIALYWHGTPQVAGMVFTGDALFAGGIGRTDFPGGNEELLMRSIREKLFVLPDDTMVLPGHGPLSTIGREKQTNPFFEQA